MLRACRDLMYTLCSSKAGSTCPASIEHCTCRLVETYGEGSWSKLVPYFSGRIGKQLRERWNHELRPDIQKGAWTEDEERALVEQHRVHRNAWADIARVSSALLCTARA